MSERMEEAYRYCAWLVGHHYENFPVASWLLPRDKRPLIAAIYAFARSADDFSDEEKYRGRGLELLAAWRRTLWACRHDGASGDVGTRVGTAAGAGSGRRQGGAYEGEAASGGSELLEHPIFLALGDAIERCGLQVQLLDDLLTAFSMDCTKRRYADWQELLTYCCYSANPVGRLVLNLFGYRDEERMRLSDSICTALQLANHWQDLSIDFLGKDRLYIPQDLMRRYGVSEEELWRLADGAAVGGGVAAGGGGAVGDGGAAGGGEATGGQGYRGLMRELVGRARTLFDEGEPLIGKVAGRLRLELKLTLLGGRAILDRIERADYDVFRHRPVLSTGDKLRLLARLVV